MKKAKSIALLLLLLLFVGLFASGIWLEVHAAHTSLDVFYSGDVVFATEDAYVNFKEYLMKTEVEITDIQILASEPPIWVRYSVSVPRSWDFPYSYDSAQGNPSKGQLFGFSFVIAVGVLGAIVSGCVLFEDKEEEGAK